MSRTVRSLFNFLDLRLTAYVLAMTVLGVAAMAAMAAVVEWREQRDVTGEAVPPTRAEGESAMDTLVQGIVLATTFAASHLDNGDRGDAMLALDGALRVSAVAQHASEGELNWALDHTMLELGKAKHAIQTGRPGTARVHLLESTRSLRRFQGEATGYRRSVSEYGYEGSLLLNALGSRIGEVFGVSAQGLVKVRIGGVTDVYGFLDFGGRIEEVPVEGLVFGEMRVIGGTHVVLASFDE